MPGMELLSSTLELIGTLSIAFAALRVHHRVSSEHKITPNVVRTMRIERKIGILGIIFVILGYVLATFF